jgi:hypothetical protein
MSQLEYKIIHFISRIFRFTLESELRFAVKYLNNKSKVKHFSTLFISVVALLLSLLNLCLLYY